VVLGQLHKRGAYPRALWNLARLREAAGNSAGVEELYRQAADRGFLAVAAAPAGLRTTEDEEAPGVDRVVLAQVEPLLRKSADELGQLRDRLVSGTGVVGWSRHRQCLGLADTLAQTMAQVWGCCPSFGARTCGRRLWSYTWRTWTAPAGQTPRRPLESARLNFDPLRTC
jgi:hypothetical protein